MSKQYTQEQIDQMIEEFHTFDINLAEVYQRYFVVKEGPAISAVKTQMETNKKVLAKLAEIAKTNGYEDIGVYGDTFIIYLKEEKIASTLGLKQYLIRRSHHVSYSPGKAPLYGFTPNGTKRGKELQQQLKSMVGDAKVVDVAGVALDKLGLSNFFPVLFQGNSGYRTTGKWLPMLKKFVVSVPWMDIPKKNMELYKKLNKANMLTDASYDHLTWEPHKSMKEIRHSEYIALFEKNNDKANKEKHS